MDLSIKVVALPQPMGGVSQRSGEKWFKGFVVGEILPAGQYTKKVVMSVFGEEKWKQFGFVVNGQYQVSFDIDAHEYNGKWFNELQIWKAVRIDGQQQQGQAQSAPKTKNQSAHAPANTPAPAPAQEKDNSDDLPF